MAGPQVWKTGPWHSRKSVGPCSQPTRPPGELATVQTASWVMLLTPGEEEATGEHPYGSPPPHLPRTARLGNSSVRPGVRGREGWVGQVCTVLALLRQSPCPCPRVPEPQPGGAEGSATGEQNSSGWDPARTAPPSPLFPPDLHQVSLPGGVPAPGSRTIQNPFSSNPCHHCTHLLSFCLHIPRGHSVAVGHTGHWPPPSVNTALLSACSVRSGHT